MEEAAHPHVGRYACFSRPEVQRASFLHARNVHALGKERETIAAQKGRKQARQTEEKVVENDLSCKKLVLELVLRFSVCLLIE